MFEHLDDPDGVTPGRRELAGILSRADSIRNRRRWTLAVGSCCVLLAASIGFFLGRPSGQPALSTTDYQFNLEKGPLPIGLPVPTTALIDVQFAHSSGWLRAGRARRRRPPGFLDGWRIDLAGPQQSPSRAAGALADQSLTQMEFVGEHGLPLGCCVSRR